MTDREKTIEALSEIMQFGMQHEAFVARCYAEALVEKIEAGDVPGVGVDGWVSTKECMPEAVGEYLCTLTNGDRMITWWSPEHEHPGFWQRRVSHWRELPKGPLL